MRAEEKAVEEKELVRMRSVGEREREKERMIEVRRERGQKKERKQSERDNCTLYFSDKKPL